MDLGNKVMVLEADEPRVPSEEEVKEYAAFLGIDVDSEPHLMWIAWEGVAAPVPAPWKACHNLEAENEDEIFYFNFETAESVWDHPCDEKYRQMVEQARAEGVPKGPGQRPGAGAAPVDAGATVAPPKPADVADIGLNGPEVIFGDISEGDEEGQDESDNDVPAAKTAAVTDKPSEDKQEDSKVEEDSKEEEEEERKQEDSKEEQTDDADNASAASSASGANAKGLTKQTGPGLSAAAKKDTADESRSNSAPSSPRDGADASCSLSMSAVAEEERRRLQPITDEISDEDSIDEELPQENSVSESGPGNNSRKLPPLKGSGGPSRLAPVGERGGGDAAAGGSGGDDGAGGPRQTSVERGLAGVGLAVASGESADVVDSSAPKEEAAASASESASKGRSGTAHHREQAKLEGSGRSGRGGSDNASEISEDFQSEFDGFTPGGSRGGEAGPGNKFGDTLELSATADQEDSSGMAVAAAAAAAATRQGRASGAAATCAAEVQSSLPSHPGEPFLSLDAQVDSLMRSLQMLKEVRAKQKEYLKLLQVA